MLITAVETVGLIISKPGYHPWPQWLSPSSLSQMLKQRPWNVRTNLSLMTLVSIIHGFIDRLPAVCYICSKRGLGTLEAIYHSWSQWICFKCFLLATKRNIMCCNKLHRRLLHIKISKKTKFNLVKEVCILIKSETYSLSSLLHQQSNHPTVRRNNHDYFNLV